MIYIFTHTHTLLVARVYNRRGRRKACSRPTVVKIYFLLNSLSTFVSSNAVRISVLHHCELWTSTSFLVARSGEQSSKAERRGECNGQSLLIDVVINGTIYSLCYAFIYRRLPISVKHVFQLLIKYKARSHTPIHTPHTGGNWRKSHHRIQLMLL